MPITRRKRARISDSSGSRGASCARMSRVTPPNTHSRAGANGRKPPPPAGPHLRARRSAATRPPPTGPGSAADGWLRRGRARPDTGPWPRRRRDGVRPRGDDADPLGPGEERQGVVDGAAGLASVLPGNHHPLRHEALQARWRHEDGRPASISRAPGGTAIGPGSPSAGPCRPTITRSAVRACSAVVATGRLRLPRQVRLATDPPRARTAPRRPPARSRARSSSAS